VSRALAAHGLSFQYAAGNEPALRGVDLRLDPGEMVLVAGPSGCGKSTLLKCLNGLIPHSYRGVLSGYVELFGERTDGMSLQRISAQMGTVLQDPDKQLVAATVRADVAFGLENRGLPRRAIIESLEEAAAALKISVLLDRPTAALSGGERQRVALAGVLALRPRIMLLDEPLANLDPATAIELLAFLRGRTLEGLAVLVVEHRVEDVLEVAPDRVLYMEEGRIAYSGGSQGFLEVADPQAVKLPFEAVRRRVATAASAPEASMPPVGGSIVSKALVTYDGVHYAYPAGDGDAVGGVSTILPSPMRVAILGPNGSGKSTLLKMALGLIHPDRGQVEVGGAPTTRQTVAHLARQVAYVFQSPRQMLFANTVREELGFAPRNQGLAPAQAQEAARRALEAVGLDRVEGIWERSPYALSFGQQKRLAIAAALTLRPRAIIVDEPSAGQDYGQAASFLGEMSSLAGLESVYFITHDVDLALLFSQRCLLLRAGRLEAEGAPLEVLADLDRLAAFRLRPTSLLKANLAASLPGGRPLDAVDLALRLQDPRTIP
jgi:energy-coupling factor transport system ATP-binding protein